LRAREAGANPGTVGNPGTVSHLAANPGTGANPGTVGNPGTVSHLADNPGTGANPGTVGNPGMVSHLAGNPGTVGNPGMEVSRVSRVPTHPSRARLRVHGRPRVNAPADGVSGFRGVEKRPELQPRVAFQERRVSPAPSILDMRFMFLDVAQHPSAPDEGEPPAGRAGEEASERDSQLLAEAERALRAEPERERFH
jgi:hypothetical protein